MSKGPSFMREATNIYLTKNYIVKQVLRLGHNDCEGTFLISHDTYYRRTPAREQQFLSVRYRYARLNGRRIPSTAYSRRYVD